MPRSRSGSRGKTLHLKALRAAAVAALALTAGGCLVAGSRFEMKTREADTLRDALAASNKEKNALEARVEALGKQVADEKASSGALSARVRVLEDESRRTGEELASARKNYEGTRITREQLISELLEKEKATGRRIQELNAKAQACEQEASALRKEAAARETAIAELKKKIEAAPNADSLRLERDVLLGRIERLKEERRLDERRRDDRFALLADAVGKISPGVSATSLGPTLRVFVPQSLLLARGDTVLTDACRAVAGEVGKAAGEFPSASVVVTASALKPAEALQAAVTRSGGIARERVLVDSGGNQAGAELLLLIP